MAMGEKGMSQVRLVAEMQQAFVTGRCRSRIDLEAMRGTTLTLALSRQRERGRSGRFRCFDALRFQIWRNSSALLVSLSRWRERVGVRVAIQYTQDIAKHIIQPHQNVVVPIPQHPKSLGL
jgi:hypothetical protein